MILLRRIIHNYKSEFEFQSFSIWKFALEKLICYVVYGYEKKEKKFRGNDRKLLIRANQRLTFVIPYGFEGCFLKVMYKKPINLWKKKKITNDRMK